MILTPIVGPSFAAIAANFVGQTFSAVANGQFDFGNFVKGNLNPLNVAKSAVAMTVPLASVYVINRALKGDDEYQALFNPFEYGFDYDYKSMAIAGAAAYLGGQAGSYIGANVGWAGQYGAKVAAMGQAAVSYTAGVKLNQLSGNKDATFSFRSFAASVATAGIFANKGEYVKPAESSIVMTDKLNWTAFKDAFLSKESLTNTGMKVVTASTEHALLKLMGDKKTEFDFKNVMLDAFGNALGNSIVSGMSGKGTPQQKQRDEKRVDELVRAGVAPGKAVQMVAEEYYGSVRGDSGASAGDSSVLHGSVNKDQQYASDELVLGNGSDKARFFTGGVSTQEDANNVLGTIRQTLGESQRAEMSYAYASNRLTAKAAAQTAFYNGEVSGIYNVHQATAQRNASFNGFRGDLMTREDWGRTISAQTQTWAQQDAASLFEMGSYLVGGGALVARGVKLMTAGALQIAKSGFRGAFIHGSSNTAAATGVVQGGARLTAGYHAADIGFNMATNPSGAADLVQAGISTGQTIYRESVRNGGFTYATGGALEFDIGTKVSMTGGGYFAFNLKTMGANSGFYVSWPLVGGAKLGIPNPTLSLGWENTIYTDPNYRGALVGNSMTFGVGDNYRNSGRAISFSYVRTGNNGNISGYQINTEIFSTGVKTDFVRNPSIFSNSSKGIIYDFSTGAWDTGD